jgi:outer membrane protein TolC
MACLIVAALGLAMAQGGQDAVPESLTAAAAAAAPLPPKKDELPPPRPDKKERPLGPPPRLEEPITPGTPVGTEMSAAALRLEDVLTSVDAFYPAVRAAEQERVLAEAGQVSARGGFDVMLRSQELFNGGTYDNQRYSLGFEQTTPLWGMSYFAGYRLGTAGFPVYYGDRKTAEGGELRAGAALPLLRGRDIDRLRASIQKADLDRAQAEPNILLQRIDIARAAARSYWGWVAAGQRYLIAREILRIARARDEQLRKRVEAGALAPIEQQDNLRVIVEREARLVVALRAFQQAAFLLSLYYRGPDGRPSQPTLAQLPSFVLPGPPPDEATRLAELEEALRRRPEVQRISLQREKTLVDIRLAENNLLPGVNLVMSAAQDFGFGKRSPQSSSPLNREAFEAGVVIDVPLQRREARGRILAGRAELARLAELEQLARDRISIEVQDAANALERAYDLLKRGRDNRLMATYIEEAERRLFDVGKSDLFRVNIRELAAAEARLLEVDAAAELFRALADYIAALGHDPTRQR